MADQPLLYFVLGAAGSDRRALLADLIAEGLQPGERAAVLVHEAEKPVEADAALQRTGAVVVSWQWQKPQIEAEIPAEASHLFLVAAGRINPIDQLEALRDWLAARPQVRLARVLGVVSARLAHAQPALLPWFAACAHFADAILVTQAAGLERRWLADFEKQIRGASPALFEILRGAAVKNPALILDPQARRLSQVFDEDMELPDETDEEVAAAKPENDPYFVRKPGGSRVITLPDIAAALDGPPA